MGTLSGYYQRWQASRRNRDERRAKLGRHRTTIARLLTMSSRQNASLS